MSYGGWYYADKWRAEAVRLSLQVENLEHEVGTLREKLRRIVGYVNSVTWREETADTLNNYEGLLIP